MTTEVMADRSELEKRLGELEPLVEEYNRLQRFVAVWDEDGNARIPSPRERSRATSATATGRRASRGSRAQQFIDAVNSQPGITVTEVAKSTGVNANYLYRVAKEQTDKGVVVKKGTGYHPGSGNGNDPSGDDE